MSRRGDGEGCIVQRKDGRWQVSIMLHGVRKTAYGKTEREARRKLRELQRQVHTAGALPDAGKRTVNDLLDAWLETVAPNLKPKTITTYRELCERHIRPAIGKVKLTKLTPVRIQAMLSRLQAEGKHRTAQQVHTYLHRAISFAVMWRWLPANPLDRVLKPRYQTERRDVWTPAELAAFLDGARGHWCYNLWVVAIATGLRSGEMRALTWDDVDFDAGTVTVGATMHRVDGEYVRTMPKTRDSARVIGLPAEAISALKRQRVQQAERRLKAETWDSPELIFTGETGKPLHKSTVKNALQRECRRLGLLVMTMHALRHLHASLLLEAGVSIPQVSKRLGHASPAITMSTYAHIVRRDDDAATLAISRAMNG